MAARHARARLAAGVFVALLTAGSSSGCDRDPIDVKSNSASVPYGRDELLAAVERFANGEHTPENYRVLAAEIERLQPRFNSEVAREAERNLVFLAIGPLEQYLDASPTEQLEALGLTVWPTALGYTPLPDEDAWTYTERLCGGPLNGSCKQIVPEHRASILAQLALSRFKERARTALLECEDCGKDPHFSSTMGRFVSRADELLASSGIDARRAHPKLWPISGSKAEPWSQLRVLRLRPDGTATLEGEPVPPEERVSMLKAQRDEAKALGLRAEPATPLARIRGAARDARAAGYSQLALQARVPEFPYELREYRVQLAEKATLKLRDEDSLQLLINSIDAKLSAGTPPPVL
ncbi:hypothetical protein [Haliangium ochraceum]|uniref:Lipoprotein n=1 Tax=Haliangium ochraceum (strain DSM 14365 / JCM 11303 / SMP-2) TaxID=502025 RepID=D0LFN5_HALO1|nr:hypothetical protein [Haliangium ochraceum]ACY12669.1 hypothetical protein Hoch_0027 [Haliangium ochraceum DSM 14365]